MRIDNSIYKFEESDLSFIGLPRVNSKTPNPLNNKAPDILRYAINNKDDYNHKTGKNAFDELRIHDAGNLKTIKSLMKKYNNQKLIIIGGEHSITKDAVMEFNKRVNDLHVVVFDAHLDVRSAGEPNACFLRELINNGVKVHLIGQRVYSKEEHEFIKKHKLKINNKINLRGKNVYVSFDIDVVDDIYVPSCSTPEPFGKDLRYYNDLLVKLAKQNNLIGIDFVEFSGETYDITYSNIASIIMNLLKTIKI